MNFFLVPTNVVFLSIFIIVIWATVSVLLAKKEYDEYSSWGWNFIPKVIIIVLIVVAGMKCSAIVAVGLAIFISLLLGAVKLILHADYDEADTATSHAHWQHRAHQAILLGLFLGLWYAQVPW